MKIAIDKNSLKIKKKPKCEYIYLFDDEPLEELLKLNMHCIYYKECNYADVNLTNYDIECIKKTAIDDKDYDKIEHKDYKLGIIIPNYNYEHTIEKCLNSIFNQTYTNYEIIFVDDCSTDNSVEIAYKTYQKYLYDTYGYYDAPDYVTEKLKVIQLKQKRLNGGARNEAYLHLSDDVDYVYYIDSDDWLYDDKCFEKINRKLQGNIDVLFVGMASFKNNELKIFFQIIINTTNYPYPSSTTYFIITK